MAKIAEMNYDGLITGLTPGVFVGAETIRKGAAEKTYKRGTVFAKSDVDGKLVILGSTPGATEEKFNGDGSAVSFTLSAKVDKIADVKVGGTSVAFTYDASTGVVTCASAPAAGTNNVVVYIPETLTPDCILCEDTVVGTSDDVNAAVYKAGCFDPKKFDVASGHTITAAEIDALRIRNIYLVEAIA